MSGVKGRSGPRKQQSTLVNEALARIDQRLPDIFESLIKKAVEGDKDAAIYLIDRRLGRPHQSIDQRVKGVILFTADDYELMSRPQAEEQKLIARYAKPIAEAIVNVPFEQEDVIKDGQVDA